MIELILVVIILAVILWFVRSIVPAFLLVLGVFVLAWLLWYANGGVERFEKSNQGAFIRPTNNYRDFETYGKVPPLPNFGTSTQR